MKQKFCSELAKYNKIHRLIGNVSCETLIRESAEALKNSETELAPYSVMVDVGAGAGVLGYAWLESRVDRRCLFLEPDSKAVAFLHAYFGGEERAKVIGKRLEDLRLEDILSLPTQKAEVLLATRAFSSFRTLEECYQLSNLDLPLYSFDEEDRKFFMARVEV